MNAKMRSCFTAHIAMHSLFGLGLGIILATAVSGLRVVWLGVALMVVAVALDMARPASQT